MYVNDSTKEITDPYLVIGDLFLYDNLAGLQELLWDFFKATITGTYPKDLSKSDRVHIVALYEHIAKLFEAVNVLYDNNRIKAPVRDMPVGKEQKPVPTLYPYSEDNLLSENLKEFCDENDTDIEDLGTIIENIVTITNADKIFLLTAIPDTDETMQYSFLILLPGTSQLTHKEYQELVNEKCADFGYMATWYSKTAKIEGFLKEGHVFFSTICTDERLVYDNGRIEFDYTDEIDILTVKEKSRAIFNNSFTVAKSFLDGARYYVTIEQLKTAAFMLHQGTEHALRALLTSLTGYNSYHHDLNNLLQNCNYCTPELNRIFPQNTEKEAAIFRLLNGAYVHTRYRSGYEIGQNDLMLLLERVDQLQKEVEQIFEERLIAFAVYFDSRNKKMPK